MGMRNSYREEKSGIYLRRYTLNPPPTTSLR